VTRGKTLKRSTQHQSALGAVVDALATYRLTVLIKDDKITEGLREAVFRRFGHLEDDDVHKASYLMGCPWCLSIYFGAVTVAAEYYAPRVWRPLARVLALSAATGLLAEALEAAQQQGA
jgi:hypothetical protein